MRKLFIILLVVASFSASSQTRFSLSQTIPTIATTPTPKSTWDVTTGYITYMAYPPQLNDNAASASFVSAAVGAVAVRNVLIHQFMTTPLVAQTLNCTVTGQIKFNMSSVASRTGTGFVYVRLINADGTVASELGSMNTSALTGTLTNRTLSTLTLTSVSVMAGQRLCFEVGWQYTTGTGTTTTGVDQLISRNSTADLPVDNTSTGSFRPWIEFSQTLKFQAQLNMF